MKMEVAYFKRLQRDTIYHYYKVVGGPGKTKNGYQEVLSFLCNKPIIMLDHNHMTDPSGLTGTWCQFEVSDTIFKEEYEKAYILATEGNFTIY